MAARKRTTSGTGASSSTGSPNSKDPEYIKKRQRNNDAVKKTRAKSKKTATDRKKRVEELTRENANLKTKIEERKRNIQTLKDILIKSSKTKEHDEMVKKILEEASDAENDE